MPAGTTMVLAPLPAGQASTAVSVFAACIASRNCQPREVGAAPAAGLVSDPLEMRANCPDADVQLLCDVLVSFALGQQSQHFPFTFA